MVEEDERPLRAVAVEACRQVRALRLRRVRLAGDAVVSKDACQELGAGALIARRIAGVDSDVAAEQVRRLACHAVPVDSCVAHAVSIGGFERIITPAPL
ncbi:MAG: hypothetical protein ABSC13_06815 [Dehalococcoidia bacterium]